MSPILLMIAASKIHNDQPDLERSDYKLFARNDSTILTAR